MNILKIFSISVIIISSLILTGWDREFIAGIVLLSFWAFLVRCLKPASVALLSFWDFLDWCLKPASEFLDFFIDLFFEFINWVAEKIKTLFLILFYVAVLCLVLYLVLYGLRAFVHFLIY
ncbi:MAG: hypothetical protein ACTSUT_00130 [Promethearchaeota archaeon]